MSKTADGLEIKKNGKMKLFCTIASEHGIHTPEICCFTVDERDNVFGVVEIRPTSEDASTRYKLLTMDATGTVQEARFLDIIEEPLCNPRMCATNEGLLVIHCDGMNTFYICSRTNAKLDYKFFIPSKDVDFDQTSEFIFTVSNNNKIICAFLRNGETKFFFMYILTLDGDLERSVHEPVPFQLRGTWKLSTVLNHVNNTILICFQCKIKYNDTFKLNLIGPQNSDTMLFSFSDTGEFLHKLDFLCSNAKLTSHPIGRVALVGRSKKFLLQV